MVCLVPGLEHSHPISICFEQTLHLQLDWVMVLLPQHLSWSCLASLQNNWQHLQSHQSWHHPWSPLNLLCQGIQEHGPGQRPQLVNLFTGKNNLPSAHCQGHMAWPPCKSTHQPVLPAGQSPLAITPVWNISIISPHLLNKVKSEVWNAAQTDGMSRSSNISYV